MVYINVQSRSSKRVVHRFLYIDNVFSTFSFVFQEYIYIYSHRSISLSKYPSLSPSLPPTLSLTLSLSLSKEDNRSTMDRPNSNVIIITCVPKISTVPRQPTAAKGRPTSERSTVNFNHCRIYYSDIIAVTEAIF